jgi:hypothetical protein
VLVALLASFLATDHSPKAIAVSAAPSAVCVGDTCTVTFNFSGDYYAWDVPGNVSSIKFDVIGAAGGTNLEYYSPAIGGKGGRIQGVLDVTGYSRLYFVPGGTPTAGSSTGGFNGGGAPGYDSSNLLYAGGGGGASDIRTVASDTATRLVVAGGGGGSGTDYRNGSCQPCGTGGAGGAGGGTTGGTGASSGGSFTPLGTGGLGGTQSGAGTGGSGPVLGSSGSANIGGTGTRNIYFDVSGGGGGGYFGGGSGGSGDGGGGGGSGGGGGGSSFCHATKCSSVTHTQGYASATSSGQIIIQYTYTPPSQTSVSLSGNVNGLKSKSPIAISISVGQPGKITVFANGKRVPGCISLPVTTSITCNWKPPVRGSVIITATLIPASSSYLTSYATPVNFSISTRSNTR